MKRRRRKHPLTRDELLAAALAIVDDEGLGALTMRRLASAVGVEPMSLYHHVPNKEVLLDWTLEYMRSEMRLPDSLPDDWAGMLEGIFVAYRDLLVAHPNMLPLASRRTDRAGTSGLGFLVEHGFAAEEAVVLYQSLVAFTVGHAVLSTTPASDWPDLDGEAAGRMGEWREDDFRNGLRALLDARGGRAP